MTLRSVIRIFLRIIYTSARRTGSERALVVSQYRITNMGKLKQLPGSLGRLAPLVRFVDATKAEQSQTRDRRHEWRAWYKTKRWRQLRWSVLMRDLFTCRRCGVIEANTSQLVADHIRPHRGDAALFWDEGQIQCLCKACHDGAKQREEAAERGMRGRGGSKV